MMMTMASTPLEGSIDQAEIRFLVEKNADGIIVVDDDGIVLFATQQQSKFSAARRPR